MELKKKLNLSSFRELGLLTFIAVLCIIVQLFNKTFFTVDNFNNLLTNTAILAILSIGMMMVILTEGIDLSLGANIALTGMIVALHVQAFPGLPPILALVEGLLIGCLCGVVVGFLVAYLNILPIIASLGMCYVYRGAAFLVSNGAWVSAHQMSNSFKGIATGKVLFINNLVFIAIIVFLAAQYFLTRTRTGRKLYAVGSNYDAARISGINASTTKLLAYSLMGALSGLSGVLWVSKFASAQPDTANGYEVNVIAACVIGGVSISGGTGKVLGVLLGSLLIGIINNALPLINVSEFWKNCIQGCIILIAILMNTIVKRRSEHNALLRRNI